MTTLTTNSVGTTAPHAYKTFPRDLSRPTIQPLFFGHGVAVSRYDVQQYPIFEKLTEKQLSFFWRPEEVDVSKDRIDFASLTPGEQHVFIMNLKYQTLLDSVQGRSPNVALLPLVSVPELETWIETWAFSETIHSRSYTHILRNVFTDPSAVFDSIVSDADITKRAESVTAHYDALIEYTKLYQLFGEGTHVINGREVKVSLRECKKLLYLTIVSVNALEAIRFYVSFACSFAFVERELMEGNGKIIRMIARDEALHLSGTQHMLNTMATGIDDEMVQIAKECRGEAARIFKEAAEQEKEWADVLFKHGSMLGLNAAILKNYVEYITNIRMTAVDLEPAFPDVKSNPIPWISTYFVSDNVQVAPQETEISSYLVGQIDNSVDMNDLGDFDL